MNETNESTRDRVLSFLEQNRPEYISGERMARRLGLSRNAVWKAVNELRAAGYDVDAVRNRGYCLGARSDILSVQGIAPLLEGPAREADIRLFASIESTNRTAKELAAAGTPHGTVIMAKSQTGGRGHNGASFASPDGGIYLSVILDPERLGPAEPARLSARSAVCVCRALEELTGLPLSIRLVTDIFWEEKKICGILNEAAFDLETGSLQWLVAGVGLPSCLGCGKNRLAAAILNRLLADAGGEEMLAYYKAHHK